MTNQVEEKMIPLHSFDWDKGKIFYYVAKMGSFSETAKLLNASQPNLSRQVSLLEEDLQCRLFNRSVRGVTLTRKGEELFHITEHYYLALKSFNYNHRVMSTNGERRKIRLHAPHIIMVHFLQASILKYNLDHPEIMFEIMTQDRKIDMAIDDIDVAICADTDDFNNVQQDHLITFHKKLYASQNYLDQKGKPQSTDDLVHHDFLAYVDRSSLFDEPDTKWLSRLLQPAGLIPEPVITSDSLEFLIESAKQGFGIVASYSELSLIKQSGLIPVLSELSGPAVKYNINYPVHLKTDDAFQQFVNYLQNQLKS